MICLHLSSSNFPTTLRCSNKSFPILFFFLRYEIKMVRNLAFLYSQFSDDEHVRFVFNHIHQFNEVGMRNLLQNVNLNVKSLKLQPRKVSLVHHFRRQRFPSVPLICNLNHGKLSALNVLEKMSSVKKQKGEHFFLEFFRLKEKGVYWLMTSPRVYSPMLDFIEEGNEDWFIILVLFSLFF